MERAWEDAIRRGGVGWIQELLAAGADVNAKDRYGQTGIMLAARDDRLDVVELLIEHGADLSVRGSGAPGFAGKTAHDLAVAQGLSELGEELRPR